MQFNSDCIKYWGYSSKVERTQLRMRDENENKNKI
jgi:hypothetical protein